MPPKKDVTIVCQLCEQETLDSCLDSHLKFNHMIYSNPVRQALFNLHYPPVPKNNFDVLLKPRRGGKSPKNLLKRESSSYLEKSAKKSRAEASPGRRHEEQSGSSGGQSARKQLIVLKPAVPLRKKLHPNTEQFLDDEVEEKVAKCTKTVQYEDAYAREDEIEHKRIVQKIRQLQENEFMCNLEKGTYVQCTEPTCNKWRLIKDVQDPSTVPDNWVCSMNKDLRLASCSVPGEVEGVSDDEDLVDVEYALGSLVWAKFKGFPWWPGLVDYCPEKEETLLLDPKTNQPQQYHVVFFDKGQNVSRSWVYREDICKLTHVNHPPRRPAFKKETVRQRYNLAKKMAEEALALDLIERVEKFSFATLYTGKWAESKEKEEDTPENIDRLTPELEIDPRLVGLDCFDELLSSHQNKTLTAKPKLKRTKISKDKLNSSSAIHHYLPPQDSDFICIKCGREVRPERALVENHLRRHRTSLQEYFKLLEESRDINYNDEHVLEENGMQAQLAKLKLWIQTDEYFSSLGQMTVGKERRKSGESFTALIRESIRRSRSSLSDPLTSPDLAGEKAILRTAGENSCVSESDPQARSPESTAPRLHDENCLTPKSNNSGTQEHPSKDVLSPKPNNPGGVTPEPHETDTEENNMIETLTPVPHLPGTVTPEPIEPHDLSPFTPILTDPAVSYPAQCTSESSSQLSPDTLSKPSLNLSISLISTSQNLDLQTNTLELTKEPWLGQNHNQHQSDAQVYTDYGQVAEHDQRGDQNQEQGDQVQLQYQDQNHVQDPYLDQNQDQEQTEKQDHDNKKSQTQVGEPDQQQAHTNHIQDRDHAKELGQPNLVPEEISAAPSETSCSPNIDTPYTDASDIFHTLESLSSLNTDQMLGKKIKKNLSSYNSPEKLLNLCQSAAQMTEDETIDATEVNEAESDTIGKVHAEQASIVKATVAGLDEDKAELDSGFPEPLEYPPPHLKTGLLIALAIRNINKKGAYMKDVIAFLCTHFPFFNSNREECWNLVTKHTTGKLQSCHSVSHEILSAEIKPERIGDYSGRFSSLRKKRSMLEHRFLDALIQGFSGVQSQEPGSSPSPPYTRDMLVCLVLLKLGPSGGTVDQLCILVQFLFPALADPAAVLILRDEFLENIHSSEYLNVQQCSPSSVFSIKDDLRSSVEEKLVLFSKENLNEILASLRQPEFLNAILPAIKED